MPLALITLMCNWMAIITNTSLNEPTVVKLMYLEVDKSSYLVEFKMTNWLLQIAYDWLVL